MASIKKDKKIDKDVESKRKEVAKKMKKEEGDGSLSPAVRKFFFKKII